MIRLVLRITVCTVVVLGCGWIAHSEAMVLLVQPETNK